MVNESSMTISDIFTTQNIIIYFIIVNVIGFLIMFIDKQKAKRGAWRIAEKTIFLVTLIGGGIGTTLGMYVFHHKSSKLQFAMGLPIITVLEIILIVYMIIT